MSRVIDFALAPCLAIGIGYAIWVWAGWPFGWDNAFWTLVGVRIAEAWQR